MSTGAEKASSAASLPESSHRLAERSTNDALPPHNLIIRLRRGALRMRVKHAIEYALLRAVSLVVNALPYQLALAVGWALAWPIHWLGRFRVAEARRRIRQVFPDIPDSRVRHIAWISFRNAVFNGMEIMRAGRLTKAWTSAHVDVRGVLDVARRHLEERPVIIAVLHMGNWDLAGQAVELGGLPSFFIMRSQRNPYTTRLLNAGRTAHGSQVLERDDPSMIRKAVRMLKEGKTMAILIDLRARQQALPLEFLGHPANIAGGVGLMAWLSGAVVLPCSLVRNGWTRHEAKVLDEILVDRAADKGAEIERITRRALTVLSAEAMRLPEQYFWYNKRWVLEPVAADAE
jgi:KDO2-lipid IV(A) lauroyltransferase